MPWLAHERCEAAHRELAPRTIDAGPLLCAKKGWPGFFRRVQCEGGLTAGCRATNLIDSA
jgi:hypothetical protein